MDAEPRSHAQRRHDTEHRLAHEVDVWVASASADGAPHLVPLSFDWDGEALLLATPTNSPTGRNLATTRVVRLALGRTRDVTMIDGEVEVLELDGLPRERGDRFAERAGFDPRVAGHVVSLVPDRPAPYPGLARGGRVVRPRADARRPVADLTLRPEANPAPPPATTPGSGAGLHPLPRSGAKCSGVDGMNPHTGTGAFVPVGDR